MLKQYYLGCLSHASYLIADESTRLAVVVDPQRDVDEYVRDAAEGGLRIGYVFLTHFHADFVAGHLELRARTGAEICLGPRARADYPFRRFADGERLELGRLRLEVLETPGHSPESISIVLYEGETPSAVLTGDTLFIGDVGRPDLRASLGWSAAELGALLYRSLHGRLLRLPDETLVYPAHGAGSMCGKKLASETVSTLGVERRTNYALQPMSEEEFVRLVTADQPEAPPYFTYDAVLNTRQRATLESTLEATLQPLSPEQVLRLANSGAQVLDTRPAAEFACGHLLDSINIALDGKYATWAGTLLDPARPIVLVASDGRAREAATRLGRIGFDRLAGYLEGGIDALADRPDLRRRTERVAPAELAWRLNTAEPPAVVDVRAPREWAEGHIAGAMNIPLNHLGERLDAVPRERLVVHCQGGYRSAIAASLLERNGIPAADLEGGIEAWKAAGLPTVVGA